MYRRKNLSVNKYGIENYIEGTDIYNSKLQNLLALDPSIVRVPYEIEQYEYRPDLICKDFYGSLDYYGLFLLTCGIELEDFRLGNTIYLIPKGILNTFIASI